MFPWQPTLVPVLKWLRFERCHFHHSSTFVKFVKKYPSFFRKMLMSTFLLRFKANYLEKNAWLPLFFFVDSKVLAKI